MEGNVNPYLQALQALPKRKIRVMTDPDKLEAIKYGLDHGWSYSSIGQAIGRGSQTVKRIAVLNGWAVVTPKVSK